MATAQSTQSLSQSPVLHQVTVQHNVQKLRASCDACAVSKVKCTKEMPVCSRCAKRGITCKYLATKRVGRSSQSSSKSSGKIQDSHQNNKYPTTEPSAPSIASPTAPALSASVPSTPLVFDQVIPSDAFNTIATPDLTFSDNGLDEYIANFITSTSSNHDSRDCFGTRSGHDPEDMLFSSTEDSIFIPTSEGLHSVVDEFMVDMDSSLEPSTTNISHAYTSSDISDVPSTLTFLSQPSDSPCCCLTIALGLLKQLSPDSIASCIHACRPGSEDEPSRPTTIESIIAQNAHVMDSVQSILQCACSADGYILTTISLVVLKAVAWYATVFHKSPDLTMHTRVGGYQIDGGKESHRMVGQLVLSELHRPQGVVSQFSERVKLHAKDTIASSVGAHKHESSLSASMLAGLETELRQQLRGIRQEIVETLQRG